MNFLTSKNLDNIVRVFQEYMKDKYTVDLEKDDNLRAITWRQMQLASANIKGTEKLQDMNIQILGILRKTYLEKLTKPIKHVSSNQNLRDVEVFGNRKIIYNDSLPVEARIHQDVSKRMETIQQQRQAEFQVKPQRPPQIDASPKDDPENIDDFIAKVKNFERERSQSILIPPPPSTLSVKPTDVFSSQQTTALQPSTVKYVIFKETTNDDIIPGEYNFHALSIKQPVSEFKMIVSLKMNDQLIPLKLQQHAILSSDTPDMYVYAIYEAFSNQGSFHITVEKTINVELEGRACDNYTIVASTRE